MRIFSWALVLVASSFALAACGSTVSSSGSGGSGGSGSTSTSTGTSGTGGSSGAICGGIAGMGCPPDEYCVFPDGSCGGGDQQGTCTQKPQVCPFEAPPWELCGCDGKVYGDRCSAAAAGADIALNGGCQLQPGQFACGGLVCETGNQYCQHTLSDVSGVPDTYNCIFLPQACGAQPSPTCACLTGESCGMSCTQAPDGTITLTCPGG
jgi:hypothetical protein